MNPKNFLARIQEIETKTQGDANLFNLKSNFSPKKLLRRNITLASSKDLKIDRRHDKDLSLHGLESSICTQGAVKYKGLNSSQNDLKNSSKVNLKSDLDGFGECSISLTHERETPRSGAAFGIFFKNRSENEHKAKFRYSNIGVESPQNYFKKNQLNNETFDMKANDPTKSKLTKSESFISEPRRFVNDKKFVLPKIKK